MPAIGVRLASVRRLARVLLASIALTAALAACGGGSATGPQGVRVCLVTKSDGLAPHSLSQVAAAGARSASPSV
ncbi:MAG TPA: hypothetical protein VGD57_05400, partial [Candidatus Dormibacteraeota bacterium]